MSLSLQASAAGVLRGWTALGLDCFAFQSRGELNYSCTNSPDTLKTMASLPPLWLFPAIK